ncbi:MAG: YgjV family protein [Clostridia bacterium]|nr:YgjV family protein [Clostridia bacterium]
MFEDILYYIGQLLGIVAVILGFVSFQMKTPKGIIAFQIITAFVFSAHYLLIGAITAMVLNLLAALNCVLYYFREKRQSNSLVEPVLYISLIIVSSILTWEGLHTLWLMLGLIAAAISLSLSDPQKTRAVMLIKSPLCLLYNAIVFSVGGIIYECAVFASSVIGLIRNRKKKTGDLYKSYIAVKASAKVFEFTNISHILHNGVKYRIIFTNKRADKRSVIHCKGNSISWEQLPLLPRLAGRTYGDKQVLSSFDDKYDGITVFVIKGKPGSITGLDDGMFGSANKFDEDHINVMSEARFMQL